MKILIISTNNLPASPAGAAYIAGAAIQAGHTVEIFECLFAHDLKAELETHLSRFQPEVIGLSIRLVHGYLLDESAEFYTRHLDLRVRVKEVVDIIRQVSRIPIILGGPGFNYYAKDWLEYLDADYGIRGEADLSFPLFLEQMENDGDFTTIPGFVFRRDGEIMENERDRIENMDETAFPAYELLDIERYYQVGISPAILTKRGCAFRCNYCPYRSLEGPKYRLKSAKRVVDEIEYIQRLKKPQMIMFCENNFNVPHNHAETICREIIRRGVDVTWGSGDLRPIQVTDDFCRLMKNSGCGYLSLSIESGSDRMLQRMRRGYTTENIRDSLASLKKSGIPFGASLMLGAPGETPETIAESLTLLDEYDIPDGVWVTIGICLWTPLQEVLADARQAGQLKNDCELFNGVNYLSPDLSREYMIQLIDTLRSKKGYAVQVNKPYPEYQMVE
jgi:radical SAM superfamily enzyme YgiQ (UPF0313 family)